MFDIETENSIAWQEREHDRFISGEYTDLPVVIYTMLHTLGVTLERTHYVHVSVKNPGMISYTPDVRMGVRDRQVRLKFGKYLNKYYGKHLATHEIAKLAAVLRTDVSELDLHLARTEQEIVHVYETGPRSCMGHGAGSFQSSVHPCTVYATEDIAIAYTVREDENGDARITARTVCNMIDRTHTTIYGDTHAIKPLLDDHGFSYGELDGCRLLKIQESGDVYVMPYLDSGEGVSHDGEYFVITDCPDYDAKSTEGLTGELGEMCEDCEEYTDEDNMTYIRDHGMVCECCIDSYVYIDSWDEYVHTDSDSIIEFEGEYYPADELSENGLCMLACGDIVSEDDAVYCDDTGEYEHVDDVTSYTTTDGDIEYTVDSNSTVEDSVSGDTILISDANEYTVDGETRYTLDSPDSDPEYEFELEVQEGA